MPLHPRALRAPLLCAGAFLLHCLIAYPGYVSFDVRSQLEQGRSGVIYDVSPPANALLLGASDALGIGTGGLFVLNAALLWIALGLLLNAVAVRPIQVLLLLAALPLIPLLPHAWSDLHLLSLLALSAALLLQAGRSESRRRRLQLWLVALLLLGWSTWVRHNAILAALPLALLPLVQGHWRRATQLGCAAVILAGLLLVRAAAGLVVDRPTSVWAVTPMWDLQALSLRADRVLLPEGLVGPGMQVAELRAAFSPNTAVPLFARTPTGVADPTVERFDVARRNALLGAWWEGVRDDPLGWAAHRWTVFRRLFGAHRGGDLRYMVDSPEFLAGAEPRGWRAALHQTFRQLIDAGKRWGLFSPAAGMLFAVGVFALGRRRGPGLAPGLQYALLASALLYVAALWPLTPSAEQRYLAWPMFALITAALLASARPASAPLISR